jgi:hypothetical protein
MYLTRGGSVQRPLTSVHRWWPAGKIPWPAGKVLCRFGLWLRAHMSTREGEGQGSGESRWRSNHMAGQPPLGELPT